MSNKMEDLLKGIKGCRVCDADLPLGPRPVVRASRTAKILIIGQAPGTKVHETGIPWNDPSGDHLREWMNVDATTFYDETRIAIMPMGFCYPGRLEKGGDSPPRPECAPLWHAKLKEQMPNIQLTLLIGQYAQRYYLGKTGKKTLTETVRSWQEYQPDYFVTPHPSWRSKIWLKKNPWFEEEVLSVMRFRIRALL
ncbi:MAG: uracil-DNA glycosylase family protein [Halopseudomonas aestusnigri]